MKLLTATVRLYRNFIDSGPVEFHDSITCLIGKNESGKTAFLAALHSLNPARETLSPPEIVRDYPRWRKVRDKREGDLEDVAYVEATFELTPDEREAVQDVVDLPLPQPLGVRVSRTYGGSVEVAVEASDEIWCRTVIDQVEQDGLRVKLAEARTLGEIRSITEAEAGDIDGRTKQYRPYQSVLDAVDAAEAASTGKLSPEQASVVLDRLPEFFYFDAVSGLPGRIDLTELRGKTNSQLDKSEQTALALLELAGVTADDFMSGEFEVRAAELEAAKNEITRQVFECWTQNQELQVQFVTDSETRAAPGGRGETVVHRYLDVRLDDLRHGMTTNFETRSTGFQWFFSFIVAFSAFESRDDVIILLDEPGLGLHAKAQEDLLRFIEERLADGRQVVYTNHSPFMVNPRRMERARLVEDLTTRTEPDIGAKVSSDTLSVKGDTLFPLQAALGYDLAQNLFVGGQDNLVVEGPADLIYLTTLSEHLQAQERTGLKDGVTIVPVGGADKIPTFVALLGAHLDDVSVLVDAGKSGNQRLQDMVDRGLLKKQRLISVGEVTGNRDPDIEDLFTDKEYLELYNSAYGGSVGEADLSGDDSIVRRLERHVGGRFDHLKHGYRLDSTA